MRLLDRYLLRELLIPLGLCLGGFLVFWLVFDLLNVLDDFRRAGLGLFSIAAYYVYRLPEMLLVVMPVALLLGLLYALTHHGRYHELTAIMAAGISVWRWSLPYFGVGLLFSFVLYFLNEGPANAGNDAAERLLRSGTQQNADRQWHGRLNFRNEREDRTWNCEAVHLGTGELRSPHVDYGVGDGTRRQIYAASARWTAGHWTFLDARVYSYDYTTNTLPAPILVTNMLAVVELTESPALMRSEIKISGMGRLHATNRPELTIAEILDYQHLHPHLAPRDRALLETQLQARLAAPWTCLVVVFIALPFGAATGRRNVFVGVASSIVICFLYFIISKVTIALGTSGHLPPAIAAWTPNFFFGATGAWLTARVR